MFKIEILRVELTDSKEECVPYTLYRLQIMEKFSPL